MITLNCSNKKKVWIVKSTQIKYINKFKCFEEYNIRTYDHQEVAGIHSPNVLSPSIWKYNGENDWKYNSVLNNRKINK